MDAPVAASYFRTLEDREVEMRGVEVHMSVVGADAELRVLVGSSPG